MRLHEITYTNISVEQLDEISFKNAVGAGIIAGASLMGGDKAFDRAQAQAPERPYISTTQSTGPKTRPIVQNIEGQRREQEKMFIQNITRKYRISSKVAARVVELAHKYEDPVFPKAIDILAIVGIESSFNPSAMSALKSDPAVGLMQVRPGVWGVDPASLQSMEAQVKLGSEILKQYYKRLNSKEDSVQAYNIGLTGFRQNRNPEAAQRYLNKYNQEIQNYVST